MDEIDKYIGFWYNERKKRWICVAPYLIRKEAAARGVTPEKIDATIAAYFDVMAMVEIEIEAITGKVNRP